MLKSANKATNINLSIDIKFFRKRLMNIPAYNRIYISLLSG